MCQQAIQSPLRPPFVSKIEDLFLKRRVRTPRASVQVSNETTREDNLL